MMAKNNQAEYAVAPGFNMMDQNSRHIPLAEWQLGPSDIGNTVDQWGPSVGAGTPIRRDGKVVGILRLDTKIDEFYSIVRSKFVPWEWFFSIMTILAFSRFILDKEVAKNF